MNFAERIARFLGVDLSQNTEIAQLRLALDEARKLKRAEEYDTALFHLGQAQQRAEKLEDRGSRVIIQLHRADVLIRLNRLNEAETLLKTLEDLAASDDHSIERAYTLDTFGTLAQAHGDWAEARRYFEAAQDAARKGSSPGAEGRAMGHLADTYMHEHNASYAVHLLRETLPKLNDSGDVELSSYFIGRLGEALIATGHNSEGEDLLGRALRLAERMEDRRHERMWHIVLGRVALEAGHDKSAYEHYIQALAILPDGAAETGGVLRAVSKASLNLALDEEALLYARRALDLEPDDPPTQGVLGVVLRTVGRSAEALPYLQTAVNHDSDQVDVVRNLAAAQADTGAFTDAMATYEHGLQVAQAQENILEEARSLRDIGLLHARQEQFHEAIKSWSAAIECFEKLGTYAQIARLFTDIASLRTKLGQGQRAMKDYEQALMVLGSVDDIDTRGVVLSNAATAYVDQGDVETAEAFFSESIKIAQKLGDRYAEATRRGNYGWFLLATGRAQRALAALDYALQLSTALDLRLHIAVQTTNKGMAHGELNQHKEAVACQREALQLVEQQQDSHWIGLIQCNLADQLLRANEVDEAARLYEAAHTLSLEHSDVEVEIRAIMGRAKIALHRGDLDVAAKPAQQAATMAGRMGLRRLFAETLMVVSEWAARNGDLETAETRWQDACKIFDVLHHPIAKKRPSWLTG